MDLPFDATALRANDRLDELRVRYPVNAKALPLSEIMDLVLPYFQLYLAYPDGFDERSYNFAIEGDAAIPQAFQPSLKSELDGHFKLVYALAITLIEAVLDDISVPAVFAGLTSVFPELSGLEQPEHLEFSIQVGDIVGAVYRSHIALIHGSVNSIVLLELIEALPPADIPLTALTELSLQTALTALFSGIRTDAAEVLRECVGLWTGSRTVPSGSGIPQDSAELLREVFAALEKVEEDHAGAVH